jgi:hypothetical protein
VTICVTDIICIHAKAPDLAFLNGVRNSLKAAVPAGYKGFRLSEPKTETQAKVALQDGHVALVVIFAHGGSDYLRGGHYQDRLGGGYYVERFMERKDLALFRNKVVFCMSCQSAQLAEDALTAGAVAFVGFDEVPFLRVDADGKIISGDKFTQQAQTLIARAVETALKRFVTGALTLQQSVDFLRLWICQSAVMFARNPKNGPGRGNVAALLLKIKDGVRYVGDADVKFRQR